MGELWRDDGLEELVRELNTSTAPADPGSTDGPPLDAPRLAELREDEPLERLLHAMARYRASDLHLVAGEPPVVRRDGRLERLGGPPLTPELIRSLIDPHLGSAARRRLTESGAVDFSLRLGAREPHPNERPLFGPRTVPAAQGALRGPDEPADRPSGSFPSQPATGSSAPGLPEESSGKRFRFNLHRQRGSLALAVRSLPGRPPTLAALGLPEGLAELVQPTRGLVLLCGPTGAGKTSTLAALIDELNRRRACHILTIEDPIEYEHRNQLAVIEQLELGRDTPSYAAALRAAMRQDPDVLLVGEMRDTETVAAALTAAETGHLVLSTLHTNDVVQAIHRIVDIFPASQQSQIRQQLALALNAIVCQQLIPRAGGGRVAAVEVLLATYPVRHHIRSEQLQKLYNEVTLGKRLGMMSLEESLARLVREGAVDREEARLRSSRPEELESLLRG